MMLPTYSYAKNQLGNLVYFDRLITSGNYRDIPYSFVPRFNCKIGGSFILDFYARYCRLRNVIQHWGLGALVVGDNFWSIQ
jgi:hypothetical protein